MSVAIRPSVRLTRRLEDLRKRVESGFPRLLEALGAEVASQAQRRIREEKAAPDGTPWAPWSARHAATRHGGHGLLMGEGDLDDSIQHFLSGPETVEIGSPLVYAATHQFGDEGRGIPARPFLGYSAGNERDLDAVIEAWLEARAA